MRPTADIIAQLLHEARSLHSQGNLANAASFYQKVLKAEPRHFDAMHLLGVLRYQQGRDAEAVKLIGTALKICPNTPHALSNYALCLQRIGRLKEAIESYDRALVVQPNYPEAYNNKGALFANIGRHEEALSCYDNAISLRPIYPEALCNRGNSQRALGRCEDALASYSDALKFEHSYFDAHLGRADVLCCLDRHQDALIDYGKALTLVPTDREALNNRGLALAHLNLCDEALRDLEQAISVDPNFSEAWNNRGNVLRKLGRHSAALASYDRALSINAKYTEALNNRGNALSSLGRFDEALASYDQALRQNPDYIDALINRANLFVIWNRHAEAIASHEFALGKQPGNLRAFLGLAEAALAACDWIRVQGVVDELSSFILEKQQIFDPTLLIRYKDDAALQLECAQNYASAYTPSIQARSRFSRAHTKIRIGYLSADFHKHATAYLTAELFEIHDRAQFEIFGISYGPDDESAMRARLVKAFDQFHDVRGKSDTEVAKLLSDLEVDIAVDLKGHTQDARTGILARRPAPIQVNYLGYPGTMGASFIDYIIADKFVLPVDQQSFYTERVVYLPDCYQVNDSKKRIASRIPTRRELGLPDDGFVFCCFNHTHKITAPVFDVWMRLLRAVPRSVLWLLRSNDSAEGNLRREALAREVEPSRLIFADKASLEEHLARSQRADLFLDTLPYNAHTSASDALWTGLPLLTCCGQTFAARVAGSLLHSVGLPELVTNNLEEYENQARRLATEDLRLQSVRHKLALHRLSFPLFNTDRFRRHIEAAYTTMWELWERNEAPRSFSVPLHGSEAGGPQL